MTLAEDDGLKIWYQDTDSIHINYEDVEVLEKKFREKYGRNLTGNDMGQLHIDFDMEDAKGEIYSVESLFLAKKVYIDKLESVDKNNNTIQDHHVRLKSVPKTCIDHTCKKQGVDPLDLFKYLYQKTIPLSLT